MNTNTQLVLELCKFLSPDREAILKLMGETPDWGYVLGHLLYNRMGSVAYKIICDLELQQIPSREFVNTLKSIAYCDKQKADSMREAIELLSRPLAEVTFPYALLKGSYLINLYATGLRTSNDIDILVNQRDLTGLEEILLRYGFEQGYIRQGQFVPLTRKEILSVRMNRGETVPFIRQIDLPLMKYIEIDVNFSLDFKAKYETDAVDALMYNAKRRIHTQNASLYTLEPRNFFIHLCTHLYKEATTYAWVERGRDQSLYKYADIYMLILSWFDSEQANIELTQRIIQYGLQKECYYAILNTMDIFKIEHKYMSKLLEEIRPKDTAFLKEIYHPSQKKTYCYNEPFSQWVFACDRKDRLYEIANEKT